MKRDFVETVGWRDSGGVAKLGERSTPAGATPCPRSPSLPSPTSRIASTFFYPPTTLV